MNGIRIDDVAREANVSPATVSLALRGVGRVAPATRARVQEVARRLGYRPNLNASILAARGTLRHEGVALGLIRQRIRGEPYPIESHVLGIRRRAAHLGYILHEHTLGDTTSLPRVLDMLWHRGCTGLVIGPLEGLESAPNHLLSRFSFVTCGRYIRPALSPSVRPEIFHAVVRLWKRLVGLGYRRIAPLLRVHDTPMLDDQERIAATLFCQAHLLGEGAALPLLLTPLSADASPEIHRYWRQHQPDAAIGFSATEYYAVSALGLACPRDFGFASFHAPTDPADPLLAIVSGCHHDDERIGEASIDAVDQLIRHRTTGLSEHSLEIVVHAVDVPGASIREQTAVRPPPSNAPTRPTTPRTGTASPTARKTRRTASPS